MAVAHGGGAWREGTSPGFSHHLQGLVLSDLLSSVKSDLLKAPRLSTVPQIRDQVFTDGPLGEH